MKNISIKTAIPGPKSRALIAEWRKYEADTTGYQAQIVWDTGRDCLVTDVDGNRYIDWTSGVLVTNVGHCHPRLVAAVQESVAKLINNYECPNTYRIEASKALMSIAPKHFDKCFFFSAGSEATDMAIRMMKRRTGKFEVLSFESSFHGRTYCAASAGGLAGNKRGYGPTLPGSIRVAYPNPYRDELGFCNDGPHFKKYFAYVESVLAANSSGSLAGIIVEPYQGAGGFIFPPKGWLTALQKWARERGLLITVDEVQSGYGRTGKMFAIEHEGLTPDILTLGKGIGCGVPVSAIFATDDVLSVFSKGDMSSTLGGNPVSSSSVPVIIDIFKKEKLVDNSAKMGKYLATKLAAIAKSSKHIGSVRGMGLIHGVEFVKDKKTKAPQDAVYIRKLIDCAAECGLLIGSVGRFGNVIRVAPPLTVTKALIDESCEAFTRAVKKASS